MQHRELDEALGTQHEQDTVKELRAHLKGQTWKKTTYNTAQSALKQ